MVNRGPMEKRALIAQTKPASGVALLCWLMVGFIVYGSLYPFHVQPLPAGATLAQAVERALAHGPGGRGDLLANIALYMPLGFALAARRSMLVALLGATLVCAALSAAIETAQIFVPERDASIWDLALNTAGGATGAVAAVLLGARRNGFGRPRLADASAGLLLVAWLGYRMYPFVPAIDHAEWSASVQPLAGDWLAEPVRVLRLAGAWLVAARLLEAALPRDARVGRWAAAMMLGTLAAAVPIIDRVLTPAEVLAVLLALPAWAVLRGRRGADAVLLAVLLAVVLAEGLAPYRLVAARPFSWLPFGALLHGQYSAGLQAVMLKFFLYGGLVWLLARVGMGRAGAAVCVVGLALAIGLAQTHLPGRSAEVTDALLALAAALVLRSGHRPHDGTG